MGQEPSADEREGIAIPCYVFECKGREHEGDRIFEKFLHNVPDKMDQMRCPQENCGAVAKRRFDKEIPTQAVIGLTPVSHSTTGKGSLAHTTEKAFGKFKKNEDGSVDTNHRAFRDSGEFEKFLNGDNDLGPPKLDDQGRAIKVPQGSGKGKYSYKLARKGAKLFQYGKNDAPSRDGVQRQSPVRRRGGQYVNGNVKADWAPRDSRDLRR